MDTQIQNKSKCLGYDKFIEVDSLARAYVPWQEMCTLYPGKEALIYGTVFPELNKQYRRKGGK